jgi:hypothetical protein
MMQHAAMQFMLNACAGRRRITPPVVRNLFDNYPFKSGKMSLCLFPRVRLENLVALFLFSPLNMASSNIACHAET